ncbi:hypothetical protein [Aliamphritea spongicola]|nr:hypothetical protein [Aliamphritea spongicola]
MQTLTSGKIATLCNVNPRTVLRWITSGKLKAFRLPGAITGYRKVILSPFWKKTGCLFRLNCRAQPALKANLLQQKRQASVFLRC